MAGVGLAGILTTAVVGALSAWAPALSAACSEEIGVWLVSTGTAAVTAAITFATGYLRRERI